jgi:hypothetical protein
VSNSAISQLQKKNEELRDLVMLLSHIALNGVFEKTELPKLPRNDAPAPLPTAMSPVETVQRLREVAVRYAHLSRLCTDRQTAEQLDSLSAGLAEAAQGIESAFSVR